MKEKFILLMEKFIAQTAVRLSDDVVSRLEELRDGEDTPLQKAIYDSYFENLKMAAEQNKPCCQDTGVLQFYIKAGTAFPYLDITSEVLTEATRRATKSVPLRPNAVDYFSDENTNDNTGERCPWIDWDIVPNSSEMEITLYFSGAGCSLPGQVKVFKPSDGIEAFIPFVYDIVLHPVCVRHRSRSWRERLPSSACRDRAWAQYRKRGEPFQKSAVKTARHAAS